MTAVRVWRDHWDEVAGTVGDRVEARWLCEEASGAFGADFGEVLDEVPTVRMIAHLDAMLERYAAGEPLQYVLGHWSFRHLDLLVDRRVLIPRPETELVAGMAIGLAATIAAERPACCADLGTGTGAIGLSIAAELPHGGAEVWLTDLSSDALDVARANLAGIGSAGASVRLAIGDWFDALPDHLRGRLDVVVANPPYVADDDPALEEIVHAWEPSMALFGGGDGLRELRRIAAAAPEWLAEGGSLVLEIGATQADDVTALLADFAEVAVHRDAAGLDRIVVARRAAFSRG